MKLDIKKNQQKQNLSSFKELLLRFRDHWDKTGEQRAHTWEPVLFYPETGPAAQEKGVWAHMHVTCIMYVDTTPAHDGNSTVISTC